MRESDWRDCKERRKGSMESDRGGATEVGYVTKKRQVSKYSFERAGKGRRCEGKFEK